MPDRPKVTVVIPTRGMAAMLRQAIKSLLASGAQDVADLEVLVIEQGGEECKAMLDKEFPGLAMIRWMTADDEWSYSELNNAAAATAPVGTGYLLLLNNDTIARRGFLTAMLAGMEDHKVGIVGAKLLFKGDRIQHIGTAFRSDGVPYHYGYGRQDDGTYAPAQRNDYADAVTFACALIRKPLWDEIGGLDPAYHFNYEDVDFCLQAREKGWRCLFAHQAVLTHLQGASGASRKTEKHSIWRNLKILRDRWITSGRLEKAIGERIQKASAALRDDRLNIAFIPSAKSAGVPWWRSELPAKKIAKLGLANVVTLYGEGDPAKNMDALSNADVVWIQGHTAEWMVKMVQQFATRPFAIIYDYDDHPLHISPLAQAYRFFGTQEIELDGDTGKFWLWRDGEKGFDIARNMEHRENQHLLFSSAEMVSTTTVPMHQYFKTLNPNVVMLPNSIDFDIWRPVDGVFRRTDGPVRIGWHGGDNHFHDIISIGPWLVDFVNTHDVELILFGAYYRSALTGIDPAKVIEEEWTHVEAFPYKLASLGIDVGLVPLADPSKPFWGKANLMAFNRFKSPIKMLEYGALRLPTLVAAGREAYSIAADQDNAMTYADEAEFKDKLDALCRDAGLRKAIGERAYDYVRAHFDLEKNAPRWVDAAQRAVDIHQERLAATVTTEEVAAALDAAVPDEALREAGSTAAIEGSPVEPG